MKKTAQLTQVLVAALLLGLFILPAPAWAQDLGDPPFDDPRHSVDYWRKVKDVAALQAEYDHYTRQLRQNQSKGGVDRYWDAYLSSLRHMLQGIRAALEERGERPRGAPTQKIPVLERPRGNNNTQPVNRPTGGRPSYVTPVAVLASAGELAACARENVSPVDCAKDLALKGSSGCPSAR